MGRGAFLAAALGVLGSGCVDPSVEQQQAQSPGTPIGTFSVAATAGDNTCGAGALGAPASYDFDVTLSESNGSIIYWSTGSGPIVSGALASDGVTFNFETSSITDMRASGGAAASSSSSSTGVIPLPPCSIERADTGAGELVGDSSISSRARRRPSPPCRARSRIR
jgi:hypothetical protein